MVRLSLTLSLTLSRRRRQRRSSPQSRRLRQSGLARRPSLLSLSPSQSPWSVSPPGPRGPSLPGPRAASLPLPIVSSLQGPRRLSSAMRALCQEPRLPMWSPAPSLPSGPSAPEGGRWMPLPPRASSSSSSRTTPAPGRKPTSARPSERSLPSFCCRRCAASFWSGRRGTRTSSGARSGLAVGSLTARWSRTGQVATLSSEPVSWIAHYVLNKVRVYGKQAAK
jgi:hypothetical protein